MMDWIRRHLHIRSTQEALEDAQKEPVVQNAMKGLKRVDRLTGSTFSDQILVELKGIEGKRR